MVTLSAVFLINPITPLIIEIKDGEIFNYQFKFREYEIIVDISVMKNSPKNGFVGSEVFKQFADKIEITLSKEVCDTPEIVLTESGGRDYTKISPYFTQYKREYSKVAIIIYKRLIGYFKYQLYQPHLDSEYINMDEFFNPRWFNSKAVDYGNITQTHHVQSYPGMDRSCLGIKTFKPKYGNELIGFLEKNYDVELFKQILSDAQSAILIGNLRRGIFEMAIVCELSAKRKYFSSDTFSGLAFDYFEDKGKINVSVIDYITKVATAVFSESFKTYSKCDFINISYLFRCRNKIAHRGDVLFKDDSGSLITPDQKLIESWYDSVMILIKWLASK